MKNIHALTVAVIAMLLAVKGSYALTSVQSNITNNSPLDIDVEVEGNTFHVLRNSAMTITYNVPSTSLGVPWVITSTTDGVLRQLSIPSVPSGSVIQILLDLVVLLNGLLSGVLGIL